MKAAVRQILGMKSSEHTVHKVNADISLKESEIRFFQRMSDKQKEEDKENA